MLNYANASSSHNKNIEDYKRVSGGLLVALNIYPKKYDIKRNKTFYKLNKFSLQYMLTHSVKMGPFTGCNYDWFSGSSVIPENKYTFSYLNIIYNFGFNF